MDNNATESALRSFCLHKHTWKLIDSLDGANASAIIYSITETAKANNLNPFRYLEYILTVLKDHQEDKECWIRPTGSKYHGYIPLGNIFCIQADDLFKVCDIASAADLPHSGDSRLDCDSGTVVQLILFQLIGEDRAGS